MIYRNLSILMQNIRGQAMIHVVRNTHKPPYMHRILHIQTPIPGGENVFYTKLYPNQPRHLRQ